MTNKTYMITVDFAGTTWAEACAKTARLDADVQRLARQSGEEVHMRQWKEPVDGAPVVLVECSETFLDKIKKLPLFDRVEPARAETIRRTSAPQIEPPQAQRPKPKGPCG